MDWKSWLNKRVYLRLKGGREYAGKVIDVDLKGNLTFISILDRYNKEVIFEAAEIKIIQEEVLNE